MLIAAPWNLANASALLMVLVAVALVAPSSSFSVVKPSSRHHIMGAHSSYTRISCDTALQLTSTPEDDLNHSSRRHVFKFLAAGLVSVGSSTGNASPAIADDSDAPFTVVLSVQLDKDTVGDIEIQVEPSWAPIAAARFRELVELGFYNDARFFRVLPGYIAQFGIASDPALNKEWLACGTPEEQQKGIRCKPLKDEPRLQPNKKGTLSFASAGQNTRQTQMFINLNDNDGIPNFLDAQGFVPFARVTKGMDIVVSKLNSEYGLVESLSGGLAGGVSQGKAAYFGKEYLNAVFPKLSYIKTAKIL